MNAQIKSWFKQFACYNAAFLLFQIIIVLYKGSSFASVIMLPMHTCLEIFLTFLIQVILYIFLSGVQTSLLWGVLSYQWKKQRYYYLRNLIILSTFIALLFTNAYFFPLSLFSRTLLPDFPAKLSLLCMLITCSFLGILFLNTLLCTFKKHPFLSGMISIIVLFGFFKPLIQSNSAIRATTKPNIILIGIDSLAPQSINHSLTPAIQSILNQSVWFNETISPLARTYPAWSSILTGLYPLHHHARDNLVSHASAPRQSIAWILQKKGYQTIFATDDRRFNTLDKAFGFQTIIGPKRGVNNILIGAFNDFPFSNLLVNSTIGRTLFPYNHINRASYFTYYPKTFDTALKKVLLSQKPDKPLFMAVHFTLPHWPYAFASSTNHELNDEYNVLHRKPLYNKALSAVDAQVATFVNTLHQQHVLDNSILVLLSDHGETLYTAGSRQTTPATYQGLNVSHLDTYLKAYTSTELDKSAGHGSDLLSSDQYHCVLGFQIYHNKQLTTAPKIIRDRVALIDIAPTLLDYVNTKANRPMDGISLLKNIQSMTPSLAKRTFFMESGMLPNQFLSAEKAREIGRQLFRVTPKQGLLQLRTDKLALLNSQKLYAVIKGDWLLALYPSNQGYLPIVQQISTNAWIDDLNTPFAKKSPALSLLNKLEKFYQHKLQIKVTS